METKMSDRRVQKLIDNPETTVADKLLRFLIHY